MLPGEKELADKLHQLVLPERKQLETKNKQAPILNKLGKLYLQVAVDQKNGEYFTKASALFNCALLRTSDESMKLELKESLTEVRSKFLTTFMVEECDITFVQWEKRSLENKNILKNLRQNVRHDCHKLENLMERYDYESDERQEMERILGVETKALSLLVKQEMSGFITMLWQQCLQDTKKEPPCKYSLLGLGSLARQEVTPYSDLEFAILVEKDSDQIQEYFKHLTYLFHLSVLDLGETPIAGMAILSLNDFQTPGGDWFFDSITPSGFKLDGSMPWACKTPVGRPATDTKEALSLIQTPVEMAQLQRSDNVLGQAYHVADVMSQTVHLVGDSQLHEVYKQEVIRLIKSKPDTFRKRGLENLKNDNNNYLDRWGINTFGYLNAKHELYRLPSISVENLRLYLNPSFLADSSWSIIEYLAKSGKISKEGAINLTTAVSIAFAYRLLTYYTNMGQYETIGFFHPSQVIADIDQCDLDASLNQNHRKAPAWKKRGLFNRHSNIINGLMDMVNDKFKNHGLSFPVDLSQETFSKDDGSKNAFFMSRDTNLYLRHNLVWAHKDGDIPVYPCGYSCMGHLAMHIEKNGSTDTKLKYIDILLQSTEYCTCMSTLEIHLKIFKYVLIKKYKLPCADPDINVAGVVHLWKSSTNIREQSFLLLGLFGMSSSFTDEALVQTIIREAEPFVTMIEKLYAHENMYLKIMEISFIYGLLYLYRLVERTEDIITLSTKWIEKIEKPMASQGISPHVLKFYGELEMAYRKIPGKIDLAIDTCKQSVIILSQICLVEPPIVTVLSDCLFALAEMLQETSHFQEAIDLLERYFTNDTSLYNFSDELKVEALGSLADSYLAQKIQNFEKALEYLEQARAILITKGMIYGLKDPKRDSMAYNLYACYLFLSKFEDLSKVVEFHEILCRAISDRVLQIFEHKQFLLKLSLELLPRSNLPELLYRQAWSFYEQACKLDEATAVLTNLDQTLAVSATDNQGELTWIDVYFYLCKLSDIYQYTKNDISAHLVFENAENVLHRYTTVPDHEKSIVNFCRVYLDCRRCACYVYVAVNHQQRFLRDTTHFLKMTKVLCSIHFPQCKSAHKWINCAIKKCERAMKKYKLSELNSPKTYIAELIERRNKLLET